MMMTTMMMTTMTTTETRPGRPIVRRLTGDVRIRILASYVILLALAALASVLVVRQALLVRLDDRVDRDLAQEIQEFRQLAGGTDPETGRPFGSNVRRIFSVYLDRNVPGVGEQLLTVPRDGVPRYRATEAADVRIDREHISRWRSLEDTEEGELETEVGPARYVAVPLAFDGRSRGSFVVAHFTARERQDVDEAVRIVAAVAAGVLLLGTVVAFLAAGRVLAPLRGLRDAARSVSGADMTRRIAVHGTDELADLGQTFNRMLDRLEFAFSSQRDFIRDISHELRTPIAVIRGHLELIAEARMTDSAERSEALTLVTGELDRMSGFVDDLLLLAKTEQPGFLRLETVPVHRLCEEVIANARGLARREWRLECGSGRSIVADPQRVTQAIMSLVRNALEHTSDADEIEIGCSVEGAVASLWVRDSGTGIAPEDQRRVFERFERGRSSRQRYEGSGLGLAIVRAIAEAHGGRVELESRLGAGATFTIELPVEGPGELEAREP
jgi:two-component system OmpR family sensor kinase